MTGRSDVDREQFFKGWPEPAKGYQCFCRPDGDYGPVDVMITIADGREFSARMMGVMRSPYSPDVLQVEFDTIKNWDDGTPMTKTERRQVAMILCWSYESQLYADESELLERPPR
jgi:hypothetical protein